MYSELFLHPGPMLSQVRVQTSKFPTSKKFQVRVSCSQDLGGSHSAFLKVFEHLWLVSIREQWNAASLSTAELLTVYKKLLGRRRGRASQFLFHLQRFHRPLKESYCNCEKYLEISSHKRKLQQILKDEERKVNSQWTMQELLSITCSSTRTLPYWADESDSSICLSKHSSSYPGSSSHEKAYTDYNLKNIGLIYVVHQLRKIQPACPFWSIKKEEKQGQSICALQSPVTRLVR